MVIEIIHGIQENILQTRWLTDYEHKVYYTVLKKESDLVHLNQT